MNRNARARRQMTAAKIPIYTTDFGFVTTTEEYDDEFRHK